MQRRIGLGPSTQPQNVPAGIHCCNCKRTGEGDIADKQATMERFEQKISGTLASTQAMLKKMMAVPRPSLHTPICSNYPSARAHARTHMMHRYT